MLKEIGHRNVPFVFLDNAIVTIMEEEKFEYGFSS
jgi:hypothetical protein